MPTAEQEAWIANFEKDIHKIMKELFNQLNKNVPRDKLFILDGHGIRRYIEAPISGSYQDIIKLSSLFTPNEKVKWTVLCEVLMNRNVKRFFIPVSHNGVYTKKEIERAKNSILVKVIELLEKSS